MAQEPDRWQRIKGLFEGARALAPAARAAYLAEACTAGDPSLEQELASLLAAHDEAGGFLEKPALEGGLVVNPDGPAPGAGMRLGAYELRGVVGTGGMGTVYAAVRADDQFEKRVAVKLIAAGCDTEHARERFRRERQILARLDHPGVARLLDGGTTPEGQPYLVMEFVEGERLDRYAAAQRLGLGARLELFLGVCDAVQYAHQRLIVHRDLKPGNILVTADGGPKLLDFGIAKLLDPEADADATATVWRPMTPEYASPEQVLGEPVGTASDVYSLGVVLYELLAGQRPYRLPGRSPAAAARMVLEGEPPAPSAAITEAAATLVSGAGVTRLRRSLQGDLDTIVLMALRKEPARRYTSVEALAADVRRHLAGFPVQARPDTFAYRAGKLVRRNVLAVSLAALVFLSLTGGIVATTWQARRAEAERARAERRFADVRALASALVFEVHDAIRDLPGATAAREAVLKRALEYLDRLAAEAAHDSAVQLELARAYTRIGNVQHGAGVGAGRRDAPAALSSYARAEGLLRGLVGDAAVERHARGALARLLLRRGLLRGAQGDRAARTDYEEAGRLAAALYEADPGDQEAGRVLSDVLLTVGNLQATEGDLERALASHRRAVEVAASLVRSPRAEAADRQFLARARAALSGSLQSRGDWSSALSEVEQSRDLWRALREAEPNNRRFGRSFAVSAMTLGDIHMTLGETQMAVDSFREALAIVEELDRADPANATAQRDLSQARARLCEALLERQRVPEAEPSCRGTLEAAQSLVRTDGGEQARWELAVGHFWMAQWLDEAGEHARALQHRREDLRLTEEMLRHHPTAYGEAGRAESYAALGVSHARHGALPDALRALERARTLREALLEKAPRNVDLRLALAENHLELGRARGRLARDRTQAGGGHGEQGRHDIRRAVEHFEQAASQRALPPPARRKLQEAREALLNPPRYRREGSKRE